MISYDWTCPICSSKFRDARSKGGHIRTKICYANADGQKVNGGPVKIVDSFHRPPSPRCVFCGESIDEDDGAVLIPKWYSWGGKNIYFHKKHLKESHIVEGIIKNEVNK